MTDAQESTQLPPGGTGLPIWQRLRLLAVVVATWLLLSAGLPLAAYAQTALQPQQSETFQRLWTALRLDETLEIVRDEGHIYALEAAVDLTGRPADAYWRRTVADIYDVAQMTARVRTDFAKALDGKDLAPLLAFYEGEVGTRVIELEITARRAYLAPGVDEAAREAWHARGKYGPRAALIRQIIEDAELIDRNVAGALNSNFAFLVAFAQAGPGNGALVDERSILDEVMRDEDIMRLDTAEWLYGYLSMAYGPLSLEALTQLVQVSDSDAGSMLNAALFKGFDPLFADLARALGQAAGQALEQTDL